MARKKDELIAEMQRNSNAWRGASPETRAALSARNTELAGAVDALTGGKSSYDGASGTWTLSDGTRSIKVGGTVEYVSPETYEDSSPFHSEMTGALAGLKNYPAFRYDAASDPLYSQYRKQYVREGERAARDTLGKAAALTGGEASSYAASAAQQAQNYYNAALTDKIPELASLAYEMYADEYAREYDRLSALMDADENAYSRWENDRSYRYKAGRDAVSDERYADETAYERSRDAVSDKRYADETAYDRSRDAASDKRYADETAYDRSRDAVSDGRYADKTAYDRSRDAISDERYADETAYERAQDAKSETKSAASGADKYAQDAEENGLALQYNEMMSTDNPEQWLIDHSAEMTDKEFALMWKYLYR